MMNDEATNETDGDGGLWLVRLPSGAVHSVTLEQLDGAYQRDLIDGNTEVLDEETGGWRKLSELLGEEEAPPAPAMSPAAAAPNAAAPNAAAPNAAAPAVRPAAIPSTLSAPPPGLNSTAPVAFDLDDLEFGGSPFKRKNRTPLYVAAGLVLGLVGVGAIVASSESDPVAGSAAVPVAAQTSLATPARALPSEPETDEETKAATKDRLDEETKRALAEAEKQYAKRRRGSKGRAKAGTSRRRSGDDFTPTKGDRNDPLNGSL